LGHTADDIRPIVRPGLTGQTLKAHVKAAVAFALPNMAGMDEISVSLVGIAPVLGTVTMYLRKFGAVLTSMLVDVSIVGEASKNLDLRQALPNSLSGSNFMRGLQSSVPVGYDLVAGGLYHDSALVDAGMKHGLTPVSLFLHQLATSVAMSKSGSQLMG
jgi:hypothetical protein